MPKPKLPGFPGLCVLLGIALVLASFPPGGARAESETETETEATVERCRTAFGSSSARYTCSTRPPGRSPVVNEQCRFKTICAMNQAFLESHNLHHREPGGRQQAEQLQRVSEGRLLLTGPGRAPAPASAVMPSPGPLPRAGGGKVEREAAPRESP